MIMYKIEEPTPENDSLKKILLKNYFDFKTGKLDMYYIL